MTEADRQWIASNGASVYISYLDSGSSTLIHVQRSDDDGITWHEVGDPVVAQGRTHSHINHWVTQIGIPWWPGLRVLSTGGA
jgi:hypothetical protein